MFHVGTVTTLHLISSKLLCSYLPQVAWHGAAGAPEVAPGARAEAGTRRAASPLREAAQYDPVACVEVGSWGCILEGGKTGWVGAGWEGGRWLEVEVLEAEGLHASRRAGGTAERTKGAWAHTRALRSSSWTADFEILPLTCTNWTWTFP